MVSTVLVVDRDEEGHIQKEQLQIYIISEVLNPFRVRYFQIQKMLYVLLITSRKLKHYFQATALG